MKVLGISLIAALALAPFGCGGDDGNSDGGDDVIVPDARPTVDAAPDSFVPPADCDYFEQNDVGNSGQAMGALEDSAIGFDGTATKTICGNLNSDHYTAPVPPSEFGLIDSDLYTFTVSSDTKVIVTLTGEGFNADKISPLLQFFGPTGTGVDVAADYDVTTHSNVTSGIVPAGTYGVYVAAASKSADKPTANGLYRIKLTLDPTTGCPAPAGATAATYVEAHDGANNTENDVISFNPSTFVATNTVSTTDAPEPTAHVTTATSEFTISGTAAANTVGNPYWDGDTYEFTTGLTSTTTRLRLDWPDAAVPPVPTDPASDLDLFVFEEPAAQGPLGVPVYQSASERTEEYVIATLKPNTKYLVFVGGYRGSSAANPPVLHTAPAQDGMPRPYSLKICGN